ncbi:helix-turn-helix transcriptional regulator [Saezia sanguinis]|uniref:helix-turn-helix transcriptional regulator n=1 Tax=Saezia sanguinis TaxID=1965230 RepID=UPI00302828CA
MAYKGLAQAGGKRLLRRKVVEDKTGFSRTTIYRLMREGLFPQSVRIGIRAVAWDEQEIDAWIEERKESFSDV